VTGGGGEAGFRTRVPPLGVSRFTRAGITTVVGLLGTDDVTRGPRDLLATVYALREEGLTALAFTGGYHVPPQTLTGTVRSDLVLIEALVGIGEVAISDHRSSQPTLDELLRLASDAHVAGLMTGKAGVLQQHQGDG
jgi:beta-aspartyl-dipeptidase (metallo-type)